MQSTSQTKQKLPDEIPKLTQEKPHRENEGNIQRKVSVSTNWLQEINKKQEKVIKSDKIQAVKKLKGDKNTKIGTNKVSGYFTNISTFRTARCNQILGGSDEKHGEKICPSKPVPDAIYLTPQELGRSRGFETRRDDVNEKYPPKSWS